jgi:hypothetical protein
MRRLAGVVVLAALVMSCALASQASASNFANCPGSGPPVQCIWVEITSGNFNVGDTSVTIVNPFTLEGGFDPNTLTFYEAEPGSTLTKAQQHLLGLYVATIELANESGHPPAPLTANPAVELSFENLLLEENTAVALPVNIKIDGPLVGSSCIVGPIALQLTTGTTSPPSPNTPIAGSAGELELLEEGNLVIIHHNKLVDNAFAEPEATGCGSPWIDLFIDALFELPSAAGNNTITFNDTFEVHD